MVAVTLACLLQSFSVFGWNALGHRLIAAIAYDHMTGHAKQLFGHYNQAMDQVYKPGTWEDAAVWLDTLRYQDISWFATMHYVDIPFTDDGSSLPEPQDINAIWAVEKATQTLLNKYPTDFDKGLSLRVLLHVVSDIHQPMHAVTRVSIKFPEGDRGGNLVPLSMNPVAKNLHAYWDRGAGLLSSKKPFTQLKIIALATEIEQTWPCSDVDATINPRRWAEESHQIAVKEAYQLPIDNKYQHNAVVISEQRIAIAGCRIALLLNKIDEDLIKKPIHHKKYRHKRRVAHG